MGGGAGGAAATAGALGAGGAAGVGAAPEPEPGIEGGGVAARAVEAGAVGWTFVVCASRMEGGAAHEVKNATANEQTIDFAAILRFRFTVCTPFP